MGKIDASPASQGKLKTGTYTGDGNATQAITGVGFQPKYLIVYKQDETVIETPAWKTDIDGLNTSNLVGTTYWYSLNSINTLDTDGFTVANGGGNVFNKNAIKYTYIAFG